MDSTSLISRLMQALVLVAITVASDGVQATSGRGAQIDATCLSFNGTTPYTTNNSNCSLCHETTRLPAANLSGPGLKVARIRLCSKTFVSCRNNSAPASAQNLG